MLTKQRKFVLSIVSAVIITLTISGSFFFTDDAFPVAPFRMFSYGNSPSGVVREMTIEITSESGENRRVGIAQFGMRRAELEEQTPWNQTVPQSRMAELAESYDSHHEDKLVALRVLVKTTQLVDGVPEEEQTIDVIGEWRAP